MREKVIEHKLLTEVKEIGGLAPRPLQLARHRLLRRLGFKVFVLDNPQQIGEIIDEIQSS